MGPNPIFFVMSVPTALINAFVIAKAFTAALNRPLDLHRYSVKRFCVIFPYAQLYCLLNRISYVRLFQVLLVTGEFDTKVSWVISASCDLPDRSAGLQHTNIYTSKEYNHEGQKEI